MKDSEYLSAARELISDPDSWAKGGWCRLSANGGVSLCIEGAVRTAVNVKAMGLNIEDLDYVRASTAATTETEFTKYLEKKLIETASAMFPDIAYPGIDLYDFNDATRFERDADGEQVEVFITHHQDVLNILDKTIAELEEQGK